VKAQVRRGSPGWAEQRLVLGQCRQSWGQHGRRGGDGEGQDRRGSQGPEARARTRPGSEKELDDELSAASHNGSTRRRHAGVAHLHVHRLFDGWHPGDVTCPGHGPARLATSPPCRRAPLEQAVNQPGSGGLSGPLTPLSLHGGEQQDLHPGVEGGDGLGVNAVLRRLDLLRELSPEEVKATAAKALEGFVPGTSGDWRDVRELLGRASSCASAWRRAGGRSSGAPRRAWRGSGRCWSSCRPSARRARAELCGRHWL